MIQDLALIRRIRDGIEPQGSDKFLARAICDMVGILGNGNIYYVDGDDGDDDYDGLSWSTAVETIQAAIDLSNATIDWSATPKHYNVILVKPGVYAEELTPAYYCVIIGMGVRGTDTAAEIHPATGSCITGTFLGTVLFNLRLEVNEASHPILDIGICNNSRIENCEFALGANVAGVNAIDTDNCTHLVVKNCDFTSGQLQNLAYGAYHRGGADKFAHNVRYINNRIWAATGGIYIADTCVASGALIQRNMIHVDGTGTGVYDAGYGYSLVVDNDIVVDGAGDALNHAGGTGGDLLNNRTMVNGSYALEPA